MLETLTAKVTNIVQAEGRGSIIFTEVTAKDKPGRQVAMQYTDPREVTKYEHGKSYTFTITQAP